jgi:hypothetical protein
MAAWDRQIDADFRPDSYVMTDRKDKRNVRITSTEPRRGKETHATNLGLLDGSRAWRFSGFAECR